MKRGEKFVLWVIGLLLMVAFAYSLLQRRDERRGEIPFYSTAPHDVALAASDLYKQYHCRECHSLWTIKDMFEDVPAPMLDGIGSLRSEAWLYEYLSAPVPQSILPSRLKLEYQMPSYANLPEGERRLMAEYLASLKVKDWYLEETRKAEYEKLTGKDYPSQ
jgi:L-cysteine S-thiosulfotransferase